MRARYPSWQQGWLGRARSATLVNWIILAITCIFRVRPGFIVGRAWKLHAKPHGDKECHGRLHQILNGLHSRRCLQHSSAKKNNSSNAQKPHIIQAVFIYWNIHWVIGELAEICCCENCHGTISLSPIHCSFHLLFNWIIIFACS